MRTLDQLIGAPIPKNIDELIRESIKIRHPFQHFSTVIISDRGIIKGISQSKPNNLITDQFGTWLAGWIRTPVVAISTVTLKESGGANKTVQMYEKTASAAVFNIDVGDKLGTVIQCGSGSTAATRADYDVETALPTAPEDAPFDTGTGVYAVGSIAAAGAIVAGGAGTIRETCLFASWVDSVNALFNFLLFHDILASPETFVLGDTITTTYTVNL